MAGFDYDDLEYGSSYYDHVNDDDDVYEDNYEDIWEGETTWEKGSTTTPTTGTSGVQLITTPPHLITTPPHIFSFGSPALPKAIHVDAGVSATTLNYPVDECADSTADDRAFAEHRADFTANGRADSSAEAVTSTPDIIPPQYDVFNDDLLMVELDDADACFVDVRKSERCDSDAGYDDDDDGLLADHVPARAQTVATGADEVSDRADSTADDRADSNADDRADPIPDDRADPTTDAPLCADSPTRRVTTDRRPGTDLSIESTTDPALNRHSTAIFLPTTTAGVKGFRCHDRAVSASDVRADSTADDRADSTADDHAVPISEDRADSTADDRADFIADDHAVAAADDRADSIVYAGADHTADEHADSTADNRADPNADDRADPSADDRADPTADAPLCADPPARRVATDGRPGTDLPVESTTDPALNRHSTAIFLSTMTAGVKGFRCHDRAVFTADDRDVSADNRADSTTNGPADSTSDDRADSAADDHPVSAADERADSNADDRADFTADDRADSNADDRADPSADDRAESTADAPLCANPPERRVTTDCRPGNDMLIESTTDPALNRHSTSIFLPTTSTGVKGFRCHDRAASTADGRADSTAGDRADSTADEHAVSIAEDRADSTADDRADSTADDRAVAADSSADPTANGRADYSNADDRAVSTAGDYAASAADERAEPTSDDHVDATADDRADSNPDDRADPIADDRADPANDAPLCADPHERRVTTDCRPGTDLSIESTIDPALNRHSTAIFLPSTTAGVKGFRCHDRAASTSDDYADSTADDRAGSTADDHAVSIAEDRANSTADGRDDSIADDHAVSAADDCADSIANVRADHTSNDRADSTANDHADSIADAYAVPTADGHAVSTADDLADSTADDHAVSTADDSTGNQIYEPATAPRSTDRPRPEHMVNAAGSVGRGVMIRAGSGAGSLVSDDDSIRKPEHMSASKKAPPPAQNRKRLVAFGQPGTTNHGNATTYGWAASVVVTLSDVLPDCVTSADMTYAAEFDVQLRNVLEFFDRLQTKRGRAHAALEPEHSASALDPAAVAEPDFLLYVEPPAALITTFHCAAGGRIESTTDPALNRHSTSVNLSMAVAGVTGCRGHD